MRSKIRNVLMVCPYFYPEGGGLENYAYHISKGLVKKGINVTVLCSTKEGADKTETIDGIKIIRQKPDFILSNTPLTLSLFATLSKLLEEEHFDLINAHTPVPYYADVAAIASRWHNVPFILSYHNDLTHMSFLLNLVAGLYNYSFNFLTLALSTKIITPSPYCFYESKLLAKFNAKLLWIPPGVDVAKFSKKYPTAIYKHKNISKKSKIVLFVGQLSSFHRHKGVDYLIDAFKSVQEKVGEARLILVGEGDLIEDYKARCRSLGIQDSVVFAGYAADKELVGYYRAATVVVLPSTTIQEGFGMTLIEAGACGKPVIGTKIGGIQYVIKDRETGLLVPPKDSKALAGAIFKILSRNLAKKMGKNGCALIKKNFGWRKSASKTETVFKTLILARKREN